MTWTCPFCERRYPDSGIGLPNDAEAYEKTHCVVCSVDPNDLRELAEEWRDERHEYRGANDITGTYWECIDGVESLLDD